MGKKSLVLFGDSLLGRFGKSSIIKLEALRDDIVVYNCAAGGLNTDDGVDRVKFIAKLKPDYVVISFGANDAAPWKEQVSTEDFKKNLDLIIKTFSGAKVIMFPCPTTNDLNDLEKTKRFNESLSLYNKTLKISAEENNAQLINSEKVYGELLKSSINYHKEDGLHLNKKGYEVLITEISNHIGNNF